jgi:DNA polymerase-3 subunit alpha
VALDHIISVSTSHFKALLSGQMSFFGNIEGVEEEIHLPPSFDDNHREQLEWEKELIGLYVSSHPLSPYMQYLKDRTTHYSTELSDVGAKEKVSVAGMVTKYRRHQTKDGKPMGFATIEDIQGPIELVLFPRTWEQYGKLIEMDRVLAVEGKVDAAQGDPKLLVDRITVIDLSNQEAAPVSAPAIQRAAQKTQAPAPESRLARPAPNKPVTSTPTTSHQIVETPPSDDEWGDMPPPPEDPDDWHNLTPPGIDTWQSNSPVEIPAVEPVLARPPLNIKPASNPEVPPQPKTVVSGPVIPPPVEPRTLPLPPMGYLVPPPTSAASAAGAKGEPLRMIKVVLRANGDKDREVRRLRRVVGMLRSSPGKDRFALMVYEKGHFFQVEFPNDTTGITADLIARLHELVWVENVTVEPINIL